MILDKIGPFIHGHACLTPICWFPTEPFRSGDGLVGTELARAKLYVLAMVAMMNRT